MFALRIVGDFGASLAVPVVVLVYLGHYLDQRYHLNSWFTILGFVLAALISGKIIYQKSKKYGEDYQRMNRY